MRVKFITIIRLIDEVGFIEREELLGRMPLMTDNTACHCTATLLGIDGNNFHFIPFFHIE